MGPAAELQAYSKLLSALENEKEYPKEAPEYDIVQKDDVVYPDQPEDIPPLPKPAPIANSQKIPKHSNKEENRKKNFRKSCKYFGFC